MQKRLLAVLVFAIFVVAAKKWTLSTTYKGTFESSAYDEIWYNDVAAGHVLFEPVWQSRMLFVELPGTVYKNLCSEQYNNCSSLFCSQNGTTLQQTNRTLFARMVNYCYYCATNVEFEQFRFRVQAKNCSHFPLYNDSHCDAQSWFHIGGMLSSNTSATKPYVCYCSTMDKYGAACDGWTSFFNEFGIIYSPIVLALFCTIMIVLTILLVLLPECNHHYTEVRKEQSKWRKCQFVLHIRLIGIYFTVLGFVMVIGEQIHIVATHRYETYYLRKGVVGVFGALGGLSVVTSYVCMLLSWSNLYWSFKNSRVVKSLDVPHKYVVVIYIYLSCRIIFALYCVICILIVAIAYILLAVTDFNTHYTILLAALMVFAVVFPFFFTIYAIAICCILSQSQSTVARNAVLTVRKLSL